MANQYLHSIPSLTSLHPALAPIANTNFSQAIQANTPIDRADVASAQSAAQMMRGLHGNAVNGVDQSCVEDAEDRAVVVQTARATATFGPGTMQAIQQMMDRIKVLEALGENERIRRRNSQHRRIITHHPLEPLQKTVQGSGLMRAQALAPAGTNVIETQAAIGDTPLNFNADIDSYNHAAILRLIEFYNEDFDIHVGDTMAARRDKFRLFLAEYI